MEKVPGSLGRRVGGIPGQEGGREGGVGVTPANLGRGGCGDGPRLVIQGRGVTWRGSHVSQCRREEHGGSQAGRGL